jgi:catechol 2,3-dioxygenase-like lactoylglutathione lyase family enzyme/ketosteroid isomerase-like protein
MRARLVGINHIALEVENVEEALAFYGQIFEFELRGRAGRMAFIDIGDQFIALSEGRTQPPDESRHFGLVVDDRDAVRTALEDAGAEILPGRGLDFRDPWGNHIQVVEYADIQFTKAPEVLHGMGLEQLEKRPQALEELRSKGIEPEAGDRAASPLDVVRAFDQAFNAGDLERMKALFIDEPEIVPLRAALEGTRYTGPNAVREFWRDAQEIWASMRTEVESDRVEGNTVVRRITWQGRARKSGIDLPQRVVARFRIEGGRIASLVTSLKPDDG